LESSRSTAMTVISADFTPQISDPPPGPPGKPQ
jgi:hypothetical protein